MASQADKVNQILNKIGAFERSKHLDEKSKTMLISTLKKELEEITGQLQLTEEPKKSLEGGEAPAPAPTPAAPAPKAK